MKQSVAFDDFTSLNLLLLDLHGSLPGEPESKEEVLSASDIVSEALEYILLLKKMLKSLSKGIEPTLVKPTAHAHTTVVTPVATNTPIITHTPIIKPVPFAQLQEPSIQHTKLVKVVYPEPARPPATSAAPNPTSGVSLVSVVPKTAGPQLFTTVVRPISIAPPVSKSLPVILPKSGIASGTQPIKIVSSSTSGAPLGHSLLKKPVTIILQPQPHTQPVRATGPLQQQFRIVNGSLVNINSLAAAAAKTGQGTENEMPNIRIEACESLRKDASGSPVQIQDSDPFDKAHGLICGSYCSCELNQVRETTIYCLTFIMCSICNRMTFR
jgi:hypothetical protein